MNKLSYLALSVYMVSVAQAQTCNPNIVRTAPDSRYELVVGSGGSEVLDKKTGLIWQRCSLGQTWNGTTCTGAAIRHTWTDALAQAKSLGNGYRLPNIRELKSLTERACMEPAINSKFFPNTTNDGYWSASPYGGDDNSAWYVYVDYGALDSGIGNPYSSRENEIAWVVDFGYGLTDGYFKAYYGPIRAVRAGQ